MTIKIIKLSFYLLFLLTPLVFAKYTSELFEYNKMMFVYTLTTIITTFWILRMVSEKRLIFKRTILDIPILLFLVSQIISTITSIDIHTSIWGYYSRSNGGLLSTLSYIILFYAFISNIEKTSAIKFLKTIIISGVLVSIYSIPEHFGISPSCILLTGEFSAGCWVQDVQARVFGTLGQPNWLAAYLAMLIFPAVSFALTSKTKLSAILYTVFAVLVYLAFTFTYSRGASLGLIAGFAVFSSALIIPGLVNLKSSILNLKSDSLNQIKILGIIFLTFMLVNIYFGSALTSFKLEDSGIAARPSIIQQQAPSGTQLENGGTESGQIRLIVWQGAIEIFKAYPLFGSGVETFAYAYYMYRPIEHNYVSEWDFLYNKAHNEYLNYLATTGIFGFVSYLAIILTFLVFCIRYYVLSIKQKSSNPYYLLLAASLLAGYISFLVQNFFLFSVVNVALLFYLFPAIVFIILEKVRPVSENSFIYKRLTETFIIFSKSRPIRVIIQSLIILICIVTLIALFNIWEADTNYKRGADYNDLNNPGRAYSFLIEAVKLNQNEPLFLAELGNAAAGSSIALTSDEASDSAQTALELKNDSEFFTDLALQISPVNTSINRTAIRTYFSLSLIDPSFQQKTIDQVDKAILLAPTDPKLLQNKGVILTQYSKYDEAIQSFRKAIEMKPNYRDARLSLAGLYIETDQLNLAQNQINEVLKLIPGDPDALKLQEQIK